ncbi:MAG TPA: NAD(P)H-hydrate dehydratase [Burkholderiales bacterium]|nr:NAD(P)H-hydrate dehydratase [Burkholderiales bacterium]
MTPIYTVAGIRRLESLAAPAPGAPTLMERAGLAAAEHARALCGEHARDILVVAGPGNNGGDAFEVAIHLKRGFHRVHVVFAGERSKLPPDAARALAKWEAAGGDLLSAIPAGVRFSLAVDGLFGIGLARPLGAAHAGLVRALNALGAPVLALDIPSGVNGDTGAAMGEAVRATRTVTFIARKPGLLTLDGPDHRGEIVVETLGVDAAALLAPEGLLAGPDSLERALRPRPMNFHKGRAGSVGILGGAAGMSGAAFLAGRAALKCGAGRTYVGLLAPIALDPVQPELMLRAAKDLFAKSLLTVLAAGPGLGRSEAAKKALDAAIGAKLPLVLDADGLNLVAASAALAKKVAAREAPTVMTPHPAEAGRLLGRETHEVQYDRVAAAKAIAKRYSALVALKGNGTVVAAPDGHWWINPTGNPGMASAGMGDVLTGIVAALLAQGASPGDAAVAGVYLHGAAADRLVASGVGPVGLTAGEVIDAARALLNSKKPG